MTKLNSAAFGGLIPILLSCLHKIKSNSSTPRRREKTLEALGSKLKNFSRQTVSHLHGFPLQFPTIWKDIHEMLSFPDFPMQLSRFVAEHRQIHWLSPMLSGSSPASFQPGSTPGNETRLESCSFHGSRHGSVSHTKSLSSPCVFKGLLDGG